MKPDYTNIKQLLAAFVDEFDGLEYEAILLFQTNIGITMTNDDAIQSIAGHKQRLLDLFTAMQFFANKQIDIVNNSFIPKE